MSLTGTLELEDFLEQNLTARSIWYCKRLSGNDTGQTRSHQAGLYLRREFLFEIFPSLERATSLNPEVEVSVEVGSHPVAPSKARVVWYNNRFFSDDGTGTRNEVRVTRLGGPDSPLRNPENTGEIALLVFIRNSSGQVDTLRVWVCRSADEADILQARIGPMEPGLQRFRIPGGRDAAIFADNYGCTFDAGDIPEAWKTVFPAGLEIFREAVSRHPASGLGPDGRLIARRRCEWEIFLAVEAAWELPNVTTGFRTLPDFLDAAQRVLQRRKSRAGRSLELHVKSILEESGLVPDRDFSFQAESEPNKKVDFLFPSTAAYHNGAFPADRLRLLGVKTSCRDRWRQVLNEANRIPHKHLLTVDTEISETQFREMTDAGLTLVIPSVLTERYPHAIRSRLLSLTDFIQSLKVT